MKKINWKDFKIKDLEPNLIPNGWDSFEPYGNEGEETRAPLEVFEENYAPNVLKDGKFSDKEYWSIVPENSDTVLSEGIVSISNDGDIGVLQQAANSSINDADLYYLRVNIRNYQSGRLVLPTYYYNLIERDNFDENGHQSALYTYNRTPFSASISHSNGSSLDIDGIYTVNLTKAFGKGNEPDKEWCDNNLKYYANWNDIPEEDKPVRAWDNMAVHFTPLGNGLTRIQTWGGNDFIKLWSMKVPVGSELNDYSTSLLIDNIGSSQLVYYAQLDGLGVNQLTLNAGDKEFLKYTGKGRGNPLAPQIRTRRVNDNLDFIASDPQIVEGDKANPVLLINELEDGREHVQVYGAYPDTKLISKEVQGFSGEPYQIKTKIDNDGVELTMTSTLGDKSIDINKGSNSISHTGELQGQHIIIELGAKDE